MAEKNITFFLVRHGEAEQNVSGIASSWPETREFHLTEKGRKQIEAVADLLSGKHIDRIFSSPICRTRETAEMIAEATGASVEFDERLRETGLGIFNGRPVSEFFEKYSPEARISPDPADGVESYIDMRARLTHFLDDIKEKCIGQSVIIVSHGDPLEQLHGILTNEAPGRSATGWYAEKGSCTEVTWRF